MHFTLVSFPLCLFVVYLSLSLYNSDGDAIKVYVRVRPLTQGTGLTTDGDRSLCLAVTSDHTVRLNSKPEPRNFTYDHVADMDTSQVRGGDVRGGLRRDTCSVCVLTEDLPGRFI